MDIDSKTLRTRLQRCNLSELSRLSGVPVRTLRRIRNASEVVEVRASTVALVGPHLKASQLSSPSKEAKLRAERAAATRAQRVGLPPQ